MLRLFALVLALLFPALAAAQDCNALAAQAGADEGLPDGLLPAIALVESGHTDANGTHAPWPWTTNEGGKSHFFETKAEAVAYLENAVASGVTTIDVGCMQLNWKWHAQAFTSPEQMFDPVENTRYAARFLRELQARLGSWEVATAAYHSTDPTRGQAYLQKVVAAQGRLPLTDMSEATLLASAPIQLDGILAFSGSPLVQLDAARAAAASAAAPRPAPRPATSGQATGGAPPDLPMVIEATRTELLAAENLPPALQRDWEAIQSMRQVLDAMP